MRRSTGKRCSKRIASGTSTAFRFSSALLNKQILHGDLGALN
jgi:hypothetical protein